MKFYKTTLATACALALSACGGGSGGGSTSQNKTGQFIDAAVQGIDVYVGNKKVDTTDAEGKFTYPAGAQLTFKVGKVTLGAKKDSDTNTANGVVIYTPANITNNERGLVNVLQFLQTLDTNANLADGIQIAADAGSKLTTEKDISKEDVSLSAIQTQIIQASGNTAIKALVDADAALAHFTATTTPITDEVKSMAGKMKGYWQSACKQGVINLIEVANPATNKLEIVDSKKRTFANKDCTGNAVTEDGSERGEATVLGVADGDSGSKTINLYDTQEKSTFVITFVDDNKYIDEGLVNVRNSRFVFDAPVPNQPTEPVDPEPSGSALEQAKSLISTAKLFASDAEAVQAAYESAAGFMSDEQSSYISEAVDVAAQLIDKAEKSGAGMTTAQINGMELGREQQYESYFKLSTTNAKVTKLANNQYALSGSITITSVNINHNREWDAQQKRWVDKITETEEPSVVVTYTGTQMTSIGSQTGTAPKVGFNFDSIVMGSGAEQVKLSMGANGTYATATLTKSATIDSNSNYADLVASGVNVSSAIVKIDNAKLEANGNTVAITTMSLEGKQFDVPLRTGGKAATVLPTKLSLTGRLQQAAPKTDLTVETTLTADAATITSAINGVKDADGMVTQIEEIDGKFLKGVWNVRIKGDATKTNNVVIPLDFNANLERTGAAQVELKNLTATVEGKQIIVTGNYKEVEDLSFVNLNFAQGNASVSTSFSEGDAGFTSAPIMVSGAKQGTLTKQSNGMFTAKFNDNTTITF